MGKHKKRSFSLFRASIIVLLLVIIILILILVLKNGVNLDNKEENNQEQINDNANNKNENINSNENVTISLNSYDVYFDDVNKLGFNFIIANLKFTSSDGALYYDLSKITTAEKIRLDDCDYYINKITACNYDISQFNLLGKEFSADAGYISGNVFIPVIKDYNNFKIYNGEDIEFDLTSHKHNLTELLFDVETEDIKTDKYDISVSNSYTENTFYTSDTNEEFPVPLALVFELSINELTTSNVHIEDATFIPNGASAGASIKCLDDHVNALKIKNIINKNLKVGDKYGLFFQISEQTVQKGKILIKFSDSDKWIEINAGE